MPRIMVTCPVTNRPAYTGLNSPEGALVQSSNNSFECEHCGEMHNWDGRDGYIEGYPPLPPPQA